MTRPPGRPTRPTPPTKARLSLYVETEGNTEIGYLTEWNKRFRSVATLTFGNYKGTDPFGLVRAAAQRMKADRTDSRRGRGAPHDEYWCVFDRDDHERIQEAMKMARDNGIHIAFSNPCIELWQILHFDPQTAEIQKEHAQKRSAELLGCGKVLSPSALDRLIELFDTAEPRAIALDAKHDGDESPPGSNPSSGVHVLVRRLKDS